ncbi:hypothetical protein F5883DRAFT_51892 [Diaporthe sp. PMI_573]|nr:hypothetical protein F5883DRAFT_51892 [Diaporthaceae sp. PMI_573]
MAICGISFPLMCSPGQSSFLSPLSPADQRSLLQPFSKGGVANPRRPSPGSPASPSIISLNSAPGPALLGRSLAESTWGAHFFFPFQTHPTAPLSSLSPSKSTWPHRARSCTQGQTGGLLTAWRGGNRWELRANAWGRTESGLIGGAGHSQSLVLYPRSLVYVSPALASSCPLVKKALCQVSSSLRKPARPSAHLFWLTDRTD